MRYEDIRNLSDRAVNSALTKLVDNDRKTKVLEVLAQVSNNKILLFSLRMK